MRAARALVADEAAWEGSFLSQESETLLGASRNYLGPVKTPYDKRVLVGRLAAFLKKEETRKTLVDLLDLLDARIVGTLLLRGPATEEDLRKLFEGELPLFDLGVRIANLRDRLVIFRMSRGRDSWLAVTPFLAEALAARVLDPALLFGSDRTGPQGGRAEDPDRGCQGPDASDAIAFFGFLLHLPGVLRKGGGLTKRGLERAEILLPFLGGPAGMEALASAFFAAGICVSEEDGGYAVDAAAMADLVSAWSARLPLYLASALAARTEEGQGEAATKERVRNGALLLERSLKALPSGLEFSRNGLRRFLELAAGREFGESAPARSLLLAAAAALGIFTTRGAEVLTVSGAFGAAPAASAPTLAAPAGPSTAAPPASPASAPRSRPTLVVEASHALHVLPEAGLADRLFAVTLAEPQSYGKVWNLELKRESVRRAFASGLDAARCAGRLSELSGRPLPQSLKFSLEAWEKEYRSLRLYHGFVLGADERMSAIIEGSPGLAALVAERLGPGLYLLAARSLEEVEGLLSEQGLEPPPEIRGHGRLSRDLGAGAPELGVSYPGDRPVEPDSRPQVFLSVFEAGDPGSIWPALGQARPDPARRLAELSRDLVALEGLTDAERRELSERLDRRLILSAEQVRQGEFRSERQEASGLDYQGKVRVVERSLRSRGDRLEILLRSAEGGLERLLLRPVRLEKAEKGLVLEAENLATGSPVRVPLGAASSVRRVRASLFGEEA